MAARIRGCLPNGIGPGGCGLPLGFPLLAQLGLLEVVRLLGSFLCGGGFPCRCSNLRLQLIGMRLQSLMFRKIGCSHKEQWQALGEGNHQAFFRSKLRQLTVLYKEELDCAFCIFLKG